jgi:TPR repeat protein
MHYYAIAARQGNAEACYALSTWYLSGDVELSEEKALYWAKAAAERGLPKAEFALGYFSEVGIGRTIDQREAMDWYIKAAKHGDPQAPKRLSALKTNTNSIHNDMTIPSSLVVGEAR